MRSELPVGPVIPVRDVDRVRLESFDDGPNQTDKDGIADMRALLIAWLRDPDDNLISIYQPT